MEGAGGTVQDGSFCEICGAGEFSFSGGDYSGGYLIIQNLIPEMNQESLRGLAERSIS